ncbi:MAG TPA: hypothetical protein VF783_25765, partial [Terriglobales bacterium]
LAKVMLTAQHLRLGDRFIDAPHTKQNGFVIAAVWTACDIACTNGERERESRTITVGRGPLIPDELLTKPSSRSIQFTESPFQSYASSHDPKSYRPLVSGRIMVRTFANTSAW